MADGVNSRSRRNKKTNLHEGRGDGQGCGRLGRLKRTVPGAHTTSRTALGAADRQTDKDYPAHHLSSFSTLRFRKETSRRKH